MQNVVIPGAAFVRFSPNICGSTTLKRKYCIECKHYMINTDMSRNENGYCRLVGTIDLVSSEKKYEKARLVRSDETLCGVNAKWFNL